MSAEMVEILHLRNHSLQQGPENNISAVIPIKMKYLALDSCEKS
jgi:hypothetical protein